MDSVQEIKLIKSAIQSYEDALARRTQITGEPLTNETRAFYEREIAHLKGKMAAILGAMPL